MRRIRINPLARANELEVAQENRHAPAILKRAKRRLSMVQFTFSCTGRPVGMQISGNILESRLFSAEIRKPNVCQAQVERQAGTTLFALEFVQFESVLSRCFNSAHR